MKSYGICLSQPGLFHLACHIYSPYIYFIYKDKVYFNVWKNNLLISVALSNKCIILPAFATRLRILYYTQWLWTKMFWLLKRCFQCSCRKGVRTRKMSMLHSQSHLTAITCQVATSKFKRLEKLNPLCAWKQRHWIMANINNFILLYWQIIPFSFSTVGFMWYY